MLCGIPLGCADDDHSEFRWVSTAGAPGGSSRFGGNVSAFDSILHTGRLFLRPLEPDDAPSLLQYAQDNRVWLEPWEPARSESYYTLEVQRNILCQCQHDRREGNGVLFGIFEQGNGRKVLGRISISGIVRGIWQNGFIGYSVDYTRTGRGYMTESLRRVVLYSFAELDLHRVQAFILPRNKASVRVAEKVGFRSEGLASRYMEIDNVWEDHVIYAFTVEDLRDAIPSSFSAK